MRTAVSEEVTRRTTSLRSGSPGTMAKRPFASSIRAPASVSKRNFVFRLAASGPWQAKHWSERIGRISRLNSISWPVSTVAASKANAPTAAAALPFAIPFPPIRSNHILHELFGGLEFRTQWTYHQSQRNGYSDETVFYSPAFVRC